MPILLPLAISIAAAGLIAANTWRGLRFRGRATPLLLIAFPAIIGGLLAAALAAPALGNDRPLLAGAWAVMIAALLANVVTDALPDHDVWIDVVLGATLIVLILAMTDGAINSNSNGPLWPLFGLLLLGGISYGMQRGATLWMKLRGVQVDPEADSPTDSVGDDQDYGFGDTAAWLLIGAALGPYFGFMAFFAATLLHGVLFALPMMIWSLARGKGFFSTHIPMIPAIAVGTLIATAAYGGIFSINLFGVR